MAGTEPPEIEADDDFLIAVEEASQAGPLPQPDAKVEPKADASEADPRSFLPAELFGTPGRKRKTLISPTRPMPKVAAPTTEKQGPVPDKGRAGRRSTDDTAVGAPSLLARATATATPYPPLRVDPPRAKGDASQGKRTKPPMPAPVTVQAKPGPARTTRSIVEREGLGKEPALTDAQRERLTREAKWAELDRELAMMEEAAEEERTQQRSSVTKPEGSRANTAPPTAERATKTVVSDAEGTVKMAAPGPARAAKTAPPEAERKTKTVVPGAERKTKTVVPDGASATKTLVPEAERKTKTVVPEGASATKTLVPESTSKPTTVVPESTSKPKTVVPDPDSDAPRVTAVPGRIDRDQLAAKGRTIPAPVVPVAKPVAAEPAPVVQRDNTPPPATPSPRPAARKRARRLPNWAVAAAFGVIGLAVGVVIASGGSDDTEGADAPPPKVASAAPTPAPTPKPKPKRVEVPEPPAEPPPAIEQPPATELPEVVAIADDTPQIYDESTTTEPTPRRRWRRRARTEAPREVLSEPTPEADPEPPPPPKPKPRPPSASALLQQARGALADGQFTTAYRLARRSNNASGSNDAVMLMARAACRNNDKDAALSALRELPLLDRGPVRRDCRKAGSRIGL